MNWLGTFLPLGTLIIGWYLSEFGKFSSEKKNDKKKIKKLLFNMLELRWLIRKELNLKNEISNYFKKMKLKFPNEFSMTSQNELNQLQNIISEAIKKTFDSSRIKEIEKNIDSTVNELAEIYPIYAFELIDTYKIKKRLDNIETYFEEVQRNTDEKALEFKEWLEPKISFDLLQELDHQIIVIARKIDKKTEREILRKFYKNSKEESDEFDSIMDELKEKIKSEQNSTKKYKFTPRKH